MDFFVVFSPFVWRSLVVCNVVVVVRDSSCLSTELRRRRGKDPLPRKERECEPPQALPLIRIMNGHKLFCILIIYLGNQIIVGHGRSLFILFFYSPSQTVLPCSALGLNLIVIPCATWSTASAMGFIDANRLKSNLKISKLIFCLSLSTFCHFVAFGRDSSLWSSYQHRTNHRR